MLNGDVMHDENPIRDEITNRSFEGEGKRKIACAAALEIAGEFGVEPSVVGGICNDLGIRISGCQLGCFP